MSKSTSYKKTLNYLFEQLPMYQRIGKAAFKKDLTNIITLCDHLKDPHQNLKTIHIAGTNGKGTVSHILAAAFQKNGYKTGLYTSPHYRDFRERIKINGKYISKKEVIKFVQQNKKLFEKIKPSFFEITVAMAFYYFRKKKTDIAIIETGLGGRLDSTNIIKPLLSVITNISLEHTDMLGNSISEIAAEKAGIIKEGIPVVIGKKNTESNDVFIKTAAMKKADIYFAEDMEQISDLKLKKFRSEFSYQNKPFKCDLTGPFINENLNTALSAINIFKKRNPEFKLKLNNFTKKISESTHFRGRWKILKRKPLIIADAAHNYIALQNTFNYIKGISYDKLHIVIGFVKGKDLSEIINILPVNADYYTCAAKVPRSLPVEKLNLLLREKGLNSKPYSSVNKAFKQSKKALNKNDMLLICGSSFVIAEIK